MALTKKQRKAIEDEWVQDSSFRIREDGASLCGFLGGSHNVNLNLCKSWVKIWNGKDCDEFVYIGCALDRPRDYDLVYLCRALTLNLLLNHEEKQP